MRPTRSWSCSSTSCPVNAFEAAERRYQVYQYVKQAGGWSTNHEIEEKTDIEWRTVRNHTLALFRLGILDRMRQAGIANFRRAKAADHRRRRRRSRPPGNGGRSGVAA